MSRLPDLEDGVLPLGVHRVELAEVERVFVHAAPFKDQRKRLFRALSLYVDVLWEHYPRARLWINGGFVTHKDWEAPDDVDVAVLIDEPDVDPTETPELWTFQDLSARTPTMAIERLQPMGGLIDGFFVDATRPEQIAYWTVWWQRRRLPGSPDKLAGKGFVEVVAP